MREGQGEGNGAEDYVVIAEDGVALRTFKLFEHARALPCRMDRRCPREKLVGSEVSGEEDGVGPQAVDVVDRIAQEEWLGELIEMNIAELGDTEAVERGRKVGDEDFRVGYFNVVARNFAGIEGEGSHACKAGGKKAAARKARRNMRKGHMFIIDRQKLAKELR